MVVTFACAVGEYFHEPIVAHLKVRFQPIVLTEIGFLKAII